ncbi:MAG: sugar phosphate isomerase/epimerase, partial [Planctomycetes bacterium]|nr:sugar phosphate isomerase/epimerase [Planctomycetota bacterium]
MYIACSTFSFGKQSFERALRGINDLHFQKIDLAIHEDGPHFKPSEIAKDVGRHAQILKTTGMSFAAFHVKIDTPDPETYKDQLRSVCRLARLMTVPVITIPSAALGSDLEAESKRLSQLCRLAEAEAVILSVETHRDHLTADPLGAAELCKRVPGLGLTLDPSEYIMGPHPHAEYDEIFPHVRHVRFRDTSPDRFQVRIGQGQVEYGKIIAQLEREDYQRG